MELARALAGQPRLLLLDETLAGLGHGEAEEVHRRRSAGWRRSGITIVIIEHTMQAMVRLVDRFVVLDHGARAGRGHAARQSRATARVIEAYLGKKWGRPMLEVEGALSARLRRPAGAHATSRSRSSEGQFVADRRPQRRRQDHAVQDHLRHRSRPASGTHPLRGRGPAARARRAPAASRHRARPGRPPGVPIAHRDGEPGDGRVSPTPAARDWKENLERILTWLPVLAERRDQLAGTLSGGEQQMLAIGRGLASSPKLLMLDEPSMGLAPTIADFIFEKLLEIRRQTRLTILLVEQRVAEALESADHGYVLEAGRVVLEGNNESLRANDRVRQAYLGM